MEAVDPAAGAIPEGEEKETAAPPPDDLPVDHGAGGHGGHVRFAPPAEAAAVAAESHARPRPDTPWPTIDTDGGAFGGAGILPEAPRHGDRPDLSSSMALGQAAFRGSAAATPTGAVVRSAASTQEAFYVASSPTGVAVGTAHVHYPVQPHPPPPTMVRRGIATPLGVHATQSAGGAGFVASALATPTNRDRPDLHSSVSMMTASFRGSAAPSTPAGSMASPPPCYAAVRAGGVVAPASPPLFPMPPQTPGSRPSTAGSTVQFRRVAMSAAGATPVIATAGWADASSANQPFAVLATPTNADRKIMMARSSRSIRGNVLAARAAGGEPDDAALPVGAPTVQSPTKGSPGSSPTTAAGSDEESRPSPPPPPPASATPSSASPGGLARRKGSAPTLANAHMGGTAGFWEAGPLATPMNLDRRDLNASLRMGTPAFRGSAAGGTPSAVTAAPLVAAPFVAAAPPPPPGQSPAGVYAGQCHTPSGLARCFPRA